MFLKLKLWLRNLLVGSASKNSRTQAEKVVRLDSGRWVSVDHPSVTAKLPMAGNCGCGHCDCK